MKIIHIAIGSLIFLQISLSGCVTTEDSSYSSHSIERNALEQRLTLARRYIGDSNWDDANRNLKLAMKIKPSDPEVYEVSALFHQSTGEYDLAEEYFLEAIKLRPDFSRARNNYAAFLYLQKRYEEARIQLLEVTSDALYSARPQAFVNLGMCQLNLDDRAGAKRSFKKALLMDSDNVLALVEMGHIAYEQGELEEAWRFFEAQRGSVAQQSSRALWLGIIVSRKLGDLDSEASLALMLKSLYPNSMEYQVYSREQ